MILTLENMPWVGRFNINPHILSNTEKMIDFLHEKNLFLTFDCTIWAREKPTSSTTFTSFTTPAASAISTSPITATAGSTCCPGGILPLTRFLNHLRNTDYSETLTLELSPHEFPKDEKIIIGSLKEIRRYLERETRQPSPDEVKL